MMGLGDWEWEWVIGKGWAGADMNGMGAVTVGAQVSLMWGL